MPNNNEYIQKRAKSLIIISSGIILFLLAGGKFTESGSFMGGSIKFEHPEYLECAIIIVFLYSLFRYHLANRNNWKNFFKTELLKKLAGRNEFKKYADELAQTYIDTLINEGKSIGNKSDWKNTEPKYHPEGQFYYRKSPNIEIVKYSPKIWIQATQKDGRKNIDEFLIDVAPRKFYYLLSRAFGSTLRKQKDFWDRVFPYFLAAAAIVSIIWEIINRIK